MPKIKAHRPRSLPQYMEIVQTLQRAAGNSLWFRGSRTVQHRLTPSLYRHPSIHSRSELQKLERELMVRFRQRSLPYHSRDLRDDWTRYSSCSTMGFRRDFSIGPKILDRPPFRIDVFNTSSKSPQVYGRGRVGSRPLRWNWTALKHVSYKGGPLTAGDDDLKGYAPGSTAMEIIPSHCMAHTTVHVLLPSKEHSQFLVREATPWRHQSMLAIFNIPTVQLKTLLHGKFLNSLMLARRQDAFFLKILSRKSPTCARIFPSSLRQDITST